MLCQWPKKESWCNNAISYLQLYPNSVDHIATELYKAPRAVYSESQDIGFLVKKIAIKTLKALFYFTIKYQPPFHSTTLRTWRK